MMSVTYILSVAVIIVDTWLVSVLKLPTCGWWADRLTDDDDDATLLLPYNFQYEINNYNNNRCV